MTNPIIIAGYSRTPMGNLQGEVSTLTASQLGAAAIQGALARANLSADQIESINMGCVLPAGQGQAPARQAALAAGIPLSAGCTTINKMCGSGMKAVMLAHDSLLAGSHEIMVAGGMENMSQAPYLLPNARSGYRLGHDKIYDHMFLDGLEDAYNKGRLMGTFADATAQKYDFSREQQDEFALQSLERAQQATNNGIFANEITAVTVKTRKETLTITQDEGPRKARPEKIPTLRPAFDPQGTVTAANSSSISDGAAALILMSESTAQQQGVAPIAKICAHATHAQEPAWFTTAPVTAIEKVCQKAGWDINDVDLFEINEAFAVVTLAAIHDLKLDLEKVNVHGGACALGHPIGASGARIMVTLLNALQHHGKKRGVAALCIGGGEATAIALELI